MNITTNSSWQAVIDIISTWGLSVVGALVWMTARVIRRERDAAALPRSGSPPSTSPATGRRGERS